MKLLAYEVDKRSFLGVLNEDETWVYPVSAAGMEYRSMKDLIREAGPSEMEMLDYISKKMPGDVTGAASVEEIKVVSPIAEPDQVSSATTCNSSPTAYSFRSLHSP